MKLSLSVAAGTLAVVSGFGLAAAATSTSTGDASPRSIASSDDAPGDISGPCDEAEHAGEARCTGVGGGTTDSTPSTSPAPTVPAGTDGAALGPTSEGGVGDARTFSAAGAGTVTYVVDGTTLRLVSATPSPGWQVEIEQAEGLEIDLDFRSGELRVQVDVEFEDGGIRERVRTRDDSTDVRTEAETLVSGTGTVTSTTIDDHGGDHDGDDDRSGHGGDDDGDDDDRSGSGSGDDDDRSGSGSGDDDRDDDDQDDDDRDDD